MSAWKNEFHWVECDRNTPEGGCDAKSPLLRSKTEADEWAAANGWQKLGYHHICPQHRTAIDMREVSREVEDGHGADADCG